MLSIIIRNLVNIILINLHFSLIHHWCEISCKIKTIKYIIMPYGYSNMSTPSISSSVSYFGKRIACNTIWLIERTLGNAIRKSCLVCGERPSRDFSTTRSHPQPWLSWINIVMLCNVKPCDRCNKGWNVQFVIPLLGIHCNYMHCKKPRGQLNGPSFSILLQYVIYPYTTCIW